jgi:hypothetical protein
MIRSETVASAIVGHRRRRPARQQIGRRLPDLDPERPARGERIAGAGPHRHREIAVRTHREIGQHADLGEELTKSPVRAGLGLTK